MKSEGIPLVTTMEEVYSPAAAQEESLITDERADLTPAQMVDRKLMSLLNKTSLPTSPLQVRDSSRVLP